MLRERKGLKQDRGDKAEGATMLEPERSMKDE